MVKINEKKIKQNIAGNIGLSGHDSVQQGKIVSGLLEKARDEASLALANSLSEEDFENLQKILREKGNAEALKFLNLKIDNAEQMVQDVAEKIIEEFKNNN